MIEVNLEHMNFEHRDFVTINKERINKFPDLDGGKVPSIFKGVNFDSRCAFKAKVEAVINGHLGVRGNGSS